MELFEFNGKFYEIVQDKYEPRELYIERVWFILESIKLGNTNIEELIKKSRIESNKKYLKCDYH